MNRRLPTRTLTITPGVRIALELTRDLTPHGRDTLIDAVLALDGVAVTIQVEHYPPRKTHYNPKLRAAIRRVPIL
jgi:hypothetical protein